MLLEMGVNEMSFEKKVVPCLDILNGKVVKGVNFEGMKELGCPSELALRYSRDGADEIVLLNIAGTSDGIFNLMKVLSDIASKVNVPIAVGGGVNSTDQMGALLRAGASKVSINSAAVKDPDLINRASVLFGRSSVISAIDAKRCGDNKWEVMVNGGKSGTGIDAVQWAKEVESRGAGEILLTSVDSDGVKEGYDIALTRAIADAGSIPVTASGGVGSLDHFLSGITEGHASAVLAASVFHTGTYTVEQVKSYLMAHNVKVRTNEKNEFDVDSLKFNSDGLIPAIVQDYSTKEVLMMAWMNRESLLKTLESGQTWFWSRSRRELWHKGETSGNVQAVRNVKADCDMDTLLITVKQTGVACHTGNRSCFFNEVSEQFPCDIASGASCGILNEVYDVLIDRRDNPVEGSYTSALMTKGLDRILKKIGEEAGEFIIAAKNDVDEETVWELADLWFHSLVVLAKLEIPVSAVYKELARRRKPSYK